MKTTMLDIDITILIVLRLLVSGESEELFHYNILTNINEIYFVGVSSRL